MSAINFSKMLAEHPLPAFAAPGDMAQVTILGVSYTIHSPRAVATSEDFKIFGDLPKEIQTKIWGFADVGRVITITEKPKRKLVQASTGAKLDDDSDDKDEEKKVDVNNAFTVTGAGLPVIFQVSKEVKKFAAAMGYQPMFQIHGSSKAVYFNPKVDTVHLRTQDNRRNLRTQVPLHQALAKNADLKHIRYLHISLPAFVKHPNSVYEDLDSLPALQELVLYGSRDVRPTSPEFTLKLRYEFDGKIAISSADVPGKPLTGDELNESLKYWVPDTEEQDVIGELYRYINLSMQDSALGLVHFPFAVKMDLSFVAASIDT